MIISNHVPSTPRRLLSTALIFGAALLPLSVAQGQDFKAVERRLGGAVEAGEITLQQAKVMMDALRRSTGGRGLAAEEYRRAEAKIKKMVAAGKMKREDAERRLSKMRRARSDKPSAKTLSRDDYARAEAKIKKMVAEGKVKREDAERRLAEMRGATGVGKRATGIKGVKPRFIPEDEYNRVRAELKKEVAAGKISEQDAQRKIAAMQTANTMAHIEKSVKEGEMTRAEADALYTRLGFK